jgi:peptidoglycan-N-acetylglucosamine deacetylase
MKSQVTKSQASAHSKRKFFVFTSNTPHLSWRVKIIMVLHVLVAMTIMTFNSCNPRYRAQKKDNVDRDTTELAYHIHGLDSLSTDSVSHKRSVYLTFDDGPNKGTPHVLRLLDSMQTPASFFVIGSHIDATPRQKSTFDSISRHPLMDVVNHTYHHGHNRYSSFYKDKSLVLGDFDEMKKFHNINTNIIRTPANNSWRTCTVDYDTNTKISDAVDYLYDHNYSVVGWDIEWKAAKNKQLIRDAQSLKAEVDKYFEEKQSVTMDHVVILLHDQHFANAKNIKTLRTFIQLLSEDSSIQIKKISEYPHI